MFKRVKIPFIIAILLLLGVVIGCNYSRFKEIDLKAANGILDLRNTSFDEKASVGGQWEFYWNKFIYPTDSVVTQQPALVNFPYKWDGQVLNGRQLPSYGYATYKITLLLPKKHKPLSLAMPDVYSAYRLFVNKRQAAVNGVVSTAKNGFVPYWEYQSIDIPNNADTIKIILQVANFVHSKGGISKPIFIGKRQEIRLDRRRAETIDMLLCGCLFMGGLFSLGLYLLGNRDKAILLFALYSLVYTYRIIGTDNYVLHTVIPDMDWYINVRLEYFSLFVGIGLFGLYTRYLYPDDINKKIVNGISIVCFSFGLASMVTSPYFFSSLINPFLFVMIFCLVYIPYTYTLAYRKKRPGSLSHC